MNAKNLTYLAGGVLIGFGAAYIALENRFGRKYAEMANANQRAYERAASLGKVHRITVDEEGVTADGVLNELGAKAAAALQEAEQKQNETFENAVTAMANYRASVVNPYHTPVEETSSEDFVAGNVNVQTGISYIEEEEYEEEDGRTKNRVDLLIAPDGDPVYLLNGMPMEDWEDRLGGSILADMFTHCPPGVPAILYVRNHRTDEDFEVERVEA